MMVEVEPQSTKKFVDKPLNFASTYINGPGSSLVVFIDAGCLLLLLGGTSALVPPTVRFPGAFAYVAVVDQHSSCNPSLSGPSRHSQSMVLSAGGGQSHSSLPAGREFSLGFLGSYLVAPCTF